MIIGYFNLYIPPMMMVFDIVATLINRHHFVCCLHRLETIDRKLAKENISIDYRSLQRASIVLIVVFTLRKYFMLFVGTLSMELQMFQLYCNLLPMYISCMAKIWFGLLVNNIRKKFDAINTNLEEICVTVKMNKSVGLKEFSVPSERTTIVSKEINEPINPFEFGYLHKEIKTGQKLRVRNNLETPIIQMIQPFMNDESKQQSNDGIEVLTMYEDKPNDINKFGKYQVGNKFDKKLSILCFVHDEMCEIAKIVNYIFSFQMLAMVSYGFLVITVHLYFGYCSFVGQVGPSHK